MELRNQVALITGASRGLGLEVARAYAARGARLMITARDAAALDAAAQELGSVTDVLAIAGDVGDETHRVRLVEHGLARFGQIDVLVNNASTVGPSPMPALEAISTSAFEGIIRINVTAPLRLAQLVIPEMRRRSSGVVINVSSDAGVEAYAGWGGYGASKAALEHLSRVLAAELDGSGVRVYVVDPGDMNTQMHQEAEPGADLSHLPESSVAAPAFVRLVEDETAAYGRFEAQRMPLSAAR